MVYDSAIIGAGSAALASGLRLSSKGKRVIVLEKQPVCGGFATNFKRKGFCFESALHCVSGLNEGEVRDFFAENNILDRVELIDLNTFCRSIFPGFDFTSDFNPERLKKYLSENFRGEEANIGKFFLAMDRFCRQFDSFRLSRKPDWLKLVLTPFLYPSLITTSPITAKSFLRKFTQNEKVTGVITDIWKFLGLPPSRVSALYFLIVFQEYFYRRTSYVKGGFGRLFKAMADEIENDGSEIRLNCEIKKIITTGKKVKSVITASGEEIIAKTVISNANAISTLCDMLDEGIREKYLRLREKEKSISAFQVYLGLKVPAKVLGMTNFLLSVNTTYNQEENYEYCLKSDYERCSLGLLDHSQIDPGLSPEGKGSLVIMTLDSYANWKKLSEREYRQKKEQTARKLIARAEEYLPHLSENIEVIEMATPLTMERYGSAPEGAIYGFAQTPEQSGIMRLSQQTAIKGLYLAGGWTQPGAGVQACFLSGMNAADLVLKYLG